MTPDTHSGRIAADRGGTLSLALPRGSLFSGCLDMLDRAGFDTAELRGDSRALIFDLGGLTVVTVRPSDVPTYVEAGAADLGITGKDVLAEQTDRPVYELADLGFGACRMVLAAVAGSDRTRPRPSAASARRGSRPSTRAPPSASSSASAARPRSSRSRARSSSRRWSASPTGSSTSSTPAAPSPRTASRSSTRSRPAPRAWSPTGSRTSCASTSSTRWSTGCATRPRA